MYEMINGDCLEVMPRLPKSGVHLVFADLPYGIVGHAWDSIIRLEKFWLALSACLSRPANVLMTATNPFAAQLVTSNLKMFRYDLVWEKNSAAGFLQAKYRPLRAHELVLVFSHAKATYVPQMTSGKAYSHHSTTAGLATYRTQNHKNKILQKSTRHPRSVLRHSVARYADGRLHPTQKPISLLTWLIATYSKQEDTVLDPAMGSGTTGVACANLGRKFIGIEKDATYFTAAKARVEAAYANAAEQVPA